jgi:hypothetical protein
MLSTLLTVAAVIGGLIVLVGVVALVTRRLGLFRAEKVTVQMRAIPDPGSAPSAFVKTQAPGASRSEKSKTSPAAPRLRETSVPAWAARLIVLDASELTIGRSISNRIVLPEDPVSADHCRIEREGDTFRLIDLGSTNKTWVNGQPVKDVVLRDGDQIRVGQTKFVFEWAPDEA